jgi:perosamine synthetase
VAPRTRAASRLAVDGGPKAYARPWRTGAFHLTSEVRVLQEVLSGPALPLARGKYVMAYRRALTELYGAKYAVTTSSGSAAIHVALAAAGIGAGDEVILSPLTDYGSIIGILQLNAIPVFADVGEAGLLLDVESAKRRITKHTRAIMPIHNGGYLVDMSSLVKLARARKLAVIEDCAQAHLSSINGRYAGTFGTAGAWSTNESKHMKSGEGGFLLTDDRKLAEYADLFADKCYPRFPGAPPTPAFPALNVRLSDVNAALALVQVKQVAGWIARRRAFGEAFDEALRGIPGIRPYPQPRGARPSYWWSLFVVDPETLGVKAGRFAEVLSAEGIPCAAGPQRYVLGWELFRKLHANPEAFRSYRPGRLAKGSFPLDACPNARASDDRVIAVQMSQHNTPAEARAAAKAIRKVAEALSSRSSRSR